MERAVERGLERRELEELRYLGLDEKSFAKVLLGLQWVENELPAEEENAGSVVSKGAETAGVSFESLNF